MKTAALISSVILSTCDQTAYDEIYRTIIQTALNSKMSVQDIREKNDAIETLRKLCRGQKSSWEEVK